ncbi:homoserine dehydrogenase [Halieaceae bacterium IMCC14734]|uniref:Homoserine dehydrogenase n=1 Tax=Candidatus Litorirhabdus singularis TaxID=2518993 RepID=A0ABT3THI4_9GAMM|nr:homoserine dehydrogenase [Candidatus Litorirhabdus singularis]MCX2981788.1 homoserine dehydrogenase [Candidatus Litorirhabdus singularis]
MDKVRVGLCGLGTVGAGTLNVLQRNRIEICARAGCDIEIVHIGTRSDKPDVDVTGIKVSRDIFDVARDPDVDIVLELIGGTTTALELVRTAISHGKHVVTANKALIAEHGNELLAEARAAGVSIAFEAAVAGGIPIIKALREGLSGNRIEWLAGIINGTGNFILTEMSEKGRDFADVLAEAQALGYAEADPTFDVEGIDAAHKLVILAAIAFGMPLQFDKVYIEGISTLESEDVDYAAELGYRIKHLGIARRSAGGVEMRVHPTLIPESRLLANVNGVKNAVLVEGDAVGPTLYYGAGAGAEPTASAVLADLVDLARDMACGQSPSVAVLGAAEGSDVPQVVPIEDVNCAWYLRLRAEDKPGVMSNVASILSDAGISIEALIQKQPPAGISHVPIIILTNQALGATVNAACAQLEALPSVVDAVARLRVESLDG